MYCKYLFTLFAQSVEHYCLCLTVTSSLIFSFAVYAFSILLKTFLLTLQQYICDTSCNFSVYRVSTLAGSFTTSMFYWSSSAPKPHHLNHCNLILMSPGASSLYLVVSIGVSVFSFSLLLFLLLLFPQFLLLLFLLQYLNYSWSIVRITLLTSRKTVFRF